MKRRDIFIRAAKSLQGAKMRTALTSLAIAVGATTITLAFAAGAAGRAFIEEQEAANGLGDSAFVSVSPKLSTAYDEVKEYKEVDATNEAAVLAADVKQDDLLKASDITAIEKVDGVASVLPLYSVSAQSIALDTANAKVFVAPYFSVHAEKMTPIDSKHVVAGAIPSSYKDEATISTDYAKAFGFSPVDLIGRGVYLNVANISGEVQAFRFRIAAVTDADTYRSDFMEIGHSDAAAINNFMYEGSVPVYSAYVYADASTTAQQIESRISDLGYSAYSSERGSESVIEAINIAQWGLVGFGAIALLAAVFGIINTQYISVLERTRQIGLMKAVGASRRDIARMFRFEAAWVGLFGGIAGVLVAYGVSLASPLLARFIGADESMRLFIFEPLTIIGILALLVTVAVASGYFPSRKAAKLDPIEALRTE